MSRWKAGGLHFLISLAIFLGLLAVIVLQWYPGILFNIDSGWAGLQLVIGVDLIAGPLLTLVVFKTGTQGLSFDLSCIAFFCSTNALLNPLRISLGPILSSFLSSYRSLKSPRRLPRFELNLSVIHSIFKLRTTERCQIRSMH